MGKIKVATLGSEDEEKLREKQKVQREEKKKREIAKKVHISGMKGGQRIKAVGVQSEEEIEKLAKLTEEVEKDQEEGFVPRGVEGIKVEVKEEKAKKKKKVRIRSKRYKEVLLKIDQGKLYPIKEAIALLRQITLTKFDGTVELHINTIEKGLRGSIMLPHGTGKKIKVTIANTDNIDKLVAEVEKGKIDFDALVAHPQVMSKLAKVAKFLGPKGLMPNPKAGTISITPEKVAEKLSKGEISWKTESDFPIIHQIIGKMSFKDSQLEDNFKALVKSIGETKIKSITLKSTMSPGIKIKFS
jgi:large subunit ribosomal protein L1